MRATSIPPRVFGFVGTLVVVTLFSAFNLNHRSSVSFGFQTIEDVPVFITCLTAFTLGAVVMVPLALRRRARGAHSDIRTEHDERSAEPPNRSEGNVPSLPPPPDNGAETGNDAETGADVPPEAPSRAWWRPWAARRR